MESKIVLIRHGITVGNEQHMYYGSTDVSLSERGMHLLEKQRDEGVYPVSEDAQYFTTGMLRTEQSLEIIYGEQEHEVIEELRELDFGEFEMCTYEQLNSVPEYQQWITAEDRTPAVTGLAGTMLCLLIFGPSDFLIPAMLLITLVLSLLKSRAGRKVDP